MINTELLVEAQAEFHTDPNLKMAAVDTDSDGVPDCFDGCPASASKTSPGKCGCGSSDVDSDGDGIPDCLDTCSSDINKIIPGSCGCGTSDVDVNKNGAADCLDPTSTTVPAPPTFTGSSSTPTIVLESFSGRVQYNVQLRSGGRVIKRISESESLSSKKLTPGRWQVRYSISVGGSEDEITTKFSVWKNFIVK